MTRQIIISALLFVAFKVCSAQIPEDFPSIDKMDLPEAKFSQTKVFNGASLFGYIDGGAELYLEYGFSMVTITEIKYLDNTYKTEIYKMNGPEEAFGIFSVSRFRCKSAPDFAEFTCQTKYLLQICRGQYFISIINSTGTLRDSIASVIIGRTISGKIKGEDVDLTKYFPGTKKEVLRSGALLAKGHLGIVNGSPDLEDFFNGLTDYTAVIFKDARTNISLKFKNDGSYNRFLELHNCSLDKSEKGYHFEKLDDTHLKIELPD